LSPTPRRSRVNDHSHTTTTPRICRLKSQPLDDTTIDQAIADLAAIWREYDQLIKQERPGHPDNAAIMARTDRLGSQANCLEWRIALSELRTPRALVTKIRAVLEAEFDGDMLAEILEGLLADAGRIAAAA
jgi:hypothetical protein